MGTPATSDSSKNLYSSTSYQTFIIRMRSGEMIVMREKTMKTESAIRPTTRRSHLIQKELDSHLISEIITLRSFHCDSLHFVCPAESESIPPPAYYTAIERMGRKEK
jgi:hypothetical protein